MSENEVIISALRVEQPLGDFYIGAVSYQELLRISTTDVRRFLDDNAEELEGIQRQLSNPRLKKLREYVGFEYATFPTSIVIAVDERCATLVEDEVCAGLFRLKIHGFVDDATGEHIPLDESAFIIDGQHRLAGLKSYTGDKPFDLNVSVFVGADRADQAEIFSTVNLTQTKVNRSLVYDLYEYRKEMSPTKMAHKVTVALDRDVESAFYKRIKRLGITTEGREPGSERLSQATVVRGLLRHLPDRAEYERNKGFLGLARKPEIGEDWRKRIFTTFYREGDDVSIFKTVKNYYGAIAAKWDTAWDSPEYMLCSTNGYNATIRFLKDAYLTLEKSSPRVVTKSEFEEIFSLIPIPDSQFTTDNYNPGSGGESSLYKDLVKHLPEKLG